MNKPSENMRFVSVPAGVISAPVLVAGLLCDTMSYDEANPQSLAELESALTLLTRSVDLYLGACYLNHPNFSEEPLVRDYLAGFGTTLSDVYYVWELPLRFYNTSKLTLNTLTDEAPHLDNERSATARIKAVAYTVGNNYSLAEYCQGVGDASLQSWWGDEFGISSPPWMKQTQIVSSLTKVEMARFRVPFGTRAPN